MKATYPWISDLPKDAVGVQEKTMGRLQGSLCGEEWILTGGITGASLSPGGHPWPRQTTISPKSCCGSGSLQGQWLSWDPHVGGRVWAGSGCHFCSTLRAVLCAPLLFTPWAATCPGRHWELRLGSQGEERGPQPPAQGQREMRDTPLPAFCGVISMEDLWVLK